MSIYCQSVPPGSDGLTQLVGRIAIVIPAYNEARHLGELIDRCCAVSPAVIVVVDDCSTDNTTSVLVEAQKKHFGRQRIVVLSNSYNLGKQGAVKRALHRLMGEALDGVAVMDGDLQHDPAELPQLSALLSLFDAVIGVRSHEEMPRRRRLSNWLVNAGFRLITGVNFMDVQSGLRLYSKPLADALVERLRHRGGFGLEHESLTALARYSRETQRTVSVAAAPVSCAYGDEDSHVGFRDIVRLAFETVRQARRFRRIVRRPALAAIA